MFRSTWSYTDIKEDTIIPNTPAAECNPVTCQEQRGSLRGEVWRGGRMGWLPVKAGKLLPSLEKHDLLSYLLSFSGKVMANP